jgi:phosphoglycolate phosphatase-like HAD superfamily hydrolase
VTLPRLTPGRPAAFVFDCDGVLIESVQIKTDAFVELFAEHPDHRDAIVAHHEQHLGVSRFDKFAWIYRELLGRELDEPESQALGRRFSQLVFESARTCPAVRGAEEALANLSQVGIPLYVASGTPQAELEKVIEARDWTDHFREIHGSPKEKPTILERILEQHSASPGDVVFVGDGWSDYQAARQTGVSFVLRETEAQATRFATYRGPRMADLRPLTEYNLDFLDA